MFGLLAWRVVALLSLHLSVRSFVRGSFLCIFSKFGGRFGSLGGLLGLILRLWERLGIFLGVRGSLGLHFGGSGDLLGSILESLGLLKGPLEPQSFHCQGTAKFPTSPTLDFGALACMGH